MNDSERRTLEAFVRSRDFGAAHAADFPANTLGKQTLDGLAGAISEINDLAAAETSGRGAARQGTVTRGQARDALIADLEALSRTARVLSPDTPGIENKFRLPRDNNDQTLLAAARAAANDALPLKTQLIAHELPADFLEDLNEHIADMQAAMSSQASGVGGHVAAGAAIDDAFARGMVFLRRLDAIMKNKYANNPALLAEWLSASHIERAPKRASPSPVPPPPPPPLPPTT